MALSYSLKISEKKLQSKLAAIMPIEKSKLGISLVLSNPLVDLSNSKDKIAVFLHVGVLLPGGKKASGRTKIAATLSYEPDHGAFYLSDLDFISLEIKNIPDKFIPVIQTVILMVTEKVLRKRPVYRLKDNTLKHKMVKLLLKSITVKNKNLVLLLSP